MMTFSNWVSCNQFRDVFGQKLRYSFVLDIHSWISFVLLLNLGIL